MRYNVSLRVQAYGEDPSSRAAVHERANIDGATGVLAYINDFIGGRPEIGLAMFADLLDTGFVSRPDFTIVCNPVPDHDLPDDSRAVDHVVGALVDDPDWSMDTLDAIVDILHTVRPDIRARITEAAEARAEVSGGKPTLKRGDRVQVPVHTDAWMSGDRYGTVALVTETVASVDMDKSQRRLVFVAEDLSLVPDVPQQRER